MSTAQELGAPGAAPRVGPLTLAGAAMLAPMSGVSDLGMRRAARRSALRWRFPRWWRARNSSPRRRSAAARRRRGRRAARRPTRRRRPAAMAEAARRLEASGAELIDINMGCPSRRVAGRAAGSALMRDLDQAFRLIEAVVGAVATPVSSRCGSAGTTTSAMRRTGAPRRGGGAAMITVHGRTRCQFYKGDADWRAVARGRRGGSRSGRRQRRLPQRSKTPAPCWRRRARAR